MDLEFPTPAPYSPPKNQKRFDRLKQWAKRNKSKLLFSTALAVIIGTGGALFAMLYLYENPTFTVSSAVPKPKPVYYSPLTGVAVKDEAATKLAVTAIMLENSPDSRPQSGLKEAGIVYEAIAEAGITRFLALYQESKPQLIGPVRSLRPYYLEWAAPYDASIAHIGGSKRALDEVRNGSYRDIDQFFNSQAYWRSTDRYAPHNVYTSFERLDTLNREKGYTSSKFTGFPRTKKDQPSKAPDAKSITVDMSSATYNSSYTYNAKSNDYTRLQDGTAHTDREKGPITPKVVVVIKVAMHYAMEDGYREQINTTGSGEAFVFQNGIVQKGTWKKAGVKDQLQFLDQAGKPIDLNRGQTWISAIPAENGVSWQ